MANVVNFTVNDTSPTISYSPFPDTFSTPNLSAGWNPYYTLSGFARTQGDVGNGTSLHITSHNGSSLLIQWHGTGIQLSGNATSASYTISLDGAPFTTSGPSGNVLATIDGLSDAPHAVALTAIVPAVQNPPNSSMVVFEKAVITSSPAPANVSFRPQTINDNDISFLGRWSFETAPSGASFHKSRTTGDRALVNFYGTTFLLQGITSPQSGNYTVTIDNVTTSLSGRSSFTSYNSLLFFVSGLNATSVHSVQVTNSGGGDLSLLVDGFDTFVPYSTSEQPPLQNSPTSVVTANKSFSQGTIAAFVLAGILGFLIITGLLFFFFVYRPWRRRRVFAETTRIPKEDEAGVLDIGPEVRKSPVPSPRPDLDSVRNGFSRWRTGAVEGNAGEASLAIRFRHSDSLDEKHPSPLSEFPHDDLSENPSTNSSTRRKARAKSKGKARQITGRSWSPSFTFDFPIRHSRSHRRSDAQDASSPVAESLGYVSTFIAAEPSPKNLAPPSYAASVSLRDSNPNSNSNPSSNPSSHPSSNMPSVPRSVSPFPGENDRSSYPLQNQETSGGFLLRSRESNSEQGSSGGNSPHRLKPPEAIQMRSLTKDDKGKSVQDNLAANNQSTLEPVSLQQVIRGLSPWAIRHPYATQDQESIHAHAPPSPQETNLGADNVLLAQVPQTEPNDDELVEVRDGVFLSVRMPSPFELSFDTRQTKLPTGGDSSGSTTALSYMTAPSSGSSEPPPPPPPPPNLPEGIRPLPPVPTRPDFVQGTSNAQFRLTPPPTTVIIAPSNSTSSNNVDSEGVTSFLDFSSSHEGSLASRSMTSSWSEDRRRRSLYPLTIEGRSRWSNTTVPSMGSKSSNHGSGGTAASTRHSSSEGSQIIPSEQRSSTFPMPSRLSIPPSPYHPIPSSRRSRASGLTQTIEHLHVHPGLEGLESPTDSVAMSVSELHFRQSVSEENTGFNSRRTTESSLVFVSSSSQHPPLPNRLDDFAPRPFDPSILVSRVLALSSPTSTITARPTGFSSSGSVTASSTPSPFASRHDTNTRGDRSNTENSDNDSLGLY